MAYDRDKEATVVISREHHELLKAIATNEGRKLRKSLELTIEEKHKSVSKSTNKTS